MMVADEWLLEQLLYRLSAFHGAGSMDGMVVTGWYRYNKYDAWGGGAIYILIPSWLEDYIDDRDREWNSILNSKLTWYPRRRPTKKKQKNTVNDQDIPYIIEFKSLRQWWRDQVSKGELGQTPLK